MAKINDGLVSMASSLGEKSSSRRFVKSGKLSDRTLQTMYDDNWIIQKYIDYFADDMTKKNRIINTPLSSSERTALELSSERLGVFNARKEALSWLSLQGEVLVVAITSFRGEETPDGYLAQPLDLEKESIDRFLVFDKLAFTPSQKRLDDITSASYNMPINFKLNPSNIEVHHSRVCWLRLGKISALERGARSAKRGVSDIQSFYKELYAYLALSVNISDIVDESKTDVLSIADFKSHINSGREEDYITLANAMKLIRSSTGMMLKDKNDDWEQKELTYTGLVEILKALRDDLAGATRMPLTRLFGQSASGFASGEEDNQNYYETVGSRQESRLRPLDQFFDRFLLNDIGTTFDKLDFSYPSIELANENEQVANLVAVTGALSQQLQDGVINEAQYASELKSRGLMSSITDQNIAFLEELANEPIAEDTTTEEIEGRQTE